MVSSLCTFRSKIENRAQKIQKLNEEFFPSGPQSIQVTPEFIERLYEYGFIGSEDANRLAPDLELSENITINSFDELIKFSTQLEKELRTK